MSVDPFAFEVLRHRLSMLNLEGALALQRVSGSPLATEALDMNTSIMSAAGEVAFVGPYLLTGPMGQGLIVRTILANDAARAALEPGDMFICNDPYSGSAHQNCVTVVAPLFAGGSPLAWAGATLHVVDVGGKTAGQVGIGAMSILDEAPVIPPTKIVRGGRIQANVERDYIQRSRTPELNALDLRAKIAAINAISAGVDRLVGANGAATIQAVIDETLDRATEHFRRRIVELPHSPIRHSAFVDQQTDDGLVQYEIALEITKTGDRLRLDFAGSSDQAPAIVNCTRSGLLSGVLIGLLTTLVWDAPWCPGAVERLVDVVSRPGSVVDAAWPGGCSMATMAAGFAATTVTAVAVGGLLARDDRLRGRAMAAWAGAVGSVDVFGVDATGRRFGTVLLDTMASGTGAGGRSDGIDCGGFLRSIGCVVANVESTEAQFPLLYLYRRQEPDTGGPGRHRGGVGVGYAVMAHGVEVVESVSPHFSGSIEPESAGLLGGYPGATNTATLVVDAGVHDARTRGRALADPDELGPDRRRLPGVARVSLGPDDVLSVVSTGGGGFGDPIERNPAAVAEDVQRGLVSPASAAEIYGVAFHPDGLVDDKQTLVLRDAIRNLRLGHGPAGTGPAPTARPVQDGWALLTDDRAPRVRCLGCGHEVTAADGPDPVGVLPTRLLPLRAAGPHVGDGRPGGFRLRARHCPACARSLAVERVRHQEAQDA